MRSRDAQIVGFIRATRGGFSFLSPEDGGEDLLVAAEALGGAIHGDRVRATLLREGLWDYRPRVQVDEILERTHPTFTGDVKKLGKGWSVRPDSPLLPERLRLKFGERAPVAGEKILFEVQNTHDRDAALYAVYRDSIGEGADATLDPIVIATEFGLDLRFSDAALDEADARAATTGDPEDDLREDFRGDLVLSIDPVDAKDFDDAIAIRRVEDGFELAVHIADVSFYVPEGSRLDTEARERGTSVYFPGSVVPMLPEVISNQAASLSPGADKRVMSVVIHFDQQGSVRGTRFARGWIKSSARLHYEEAQAILEGKEGAPPPITAALADMAALAALLRSRRFREGAYDLDIPEVEMALGADGVPVQVTHHATHDSNRLIEEFMIAANLAVGDLGLAEELPLLYRIHEEPDPRALARFAGTALALFPGTRLEELENLPRLRRWLKQLPNTPRGRVLQRFFLRSLKKAVYSDLDRGHFGLGVEGYCHFTSPIRRYPDLWNHRRLKERLNGRRRADLLEPARATGLLASRTEANAEDADREMLRLKGARFLARHLGEEFDGSVTGITPRGLFVELAPWPLEGFVPRASLGRGASFLEERLTWVEERGAWEYRPGDRIRVQIVRVDLRTRQVEFGLASRARAPHGRNRRQKSLRAKGRSSKRPGRRGRKQR